MGRKGGKYKRKEKSGIVKNNSVLLDSDDEDMMNDEIDAFHKSRDVVPLTISDDMDDPDEDNEQPVFDFEHARYVLSQFFFFNDYDVKDDDDEDDEDEDIDDEDKAPKGLAAKIVRQQKYLRSKFGGVEDALLDDADEEDQERFVWPRKSDLYGADVHEPQSSDDEDAAEEEKEVLKLQSKRAEVLSMKDFGLEDASQDDSDTEPIFEEILDHRKPTTKAFIDKEIKDEDGITYEIVHKDLNALTKEEQMDIVKSVHLTACCCILLLILCECYPDDWFNSSAPELIGLLSQLNDALEQLDRVTPLVDKIRGRERAKKGGMHYLEVKQHLLQSFCQAITFYLLLKSEGQPVRDHPVIDRLVEIKGLLDKVKEMDEKLIFDVEDTVNNDLNNTTVMELAEENAVLGSDSLANNQIFSTVSSKRQALLEPIKAADLNILRTSNNTEVQCKHQAKQVGSQSMEMLKIRASLDEKVKQKCVFSSIDTKNGRTIKHVQPVNRQLETLDDFVDEAMGIDALANGRSNGDAGLSHTNRTSQQPVIRHNKRKILCLITVIFMALTPNVVGIKFRMMMMMMSDRLNFLVISGDDDIPKRDDIGERRRKHELRVLAGAGIGLVDDVEDDATNISSDGIADANEESDVNSDLDYYEQVKREHAAKLAAKSDKYSRNMEVPSLPDTVIDGKRHITRQIEKNRGLTRSRKKQKKNPRTSYKMKHQKAQTRRKGQVQGIIKPTRPYGGEASGINPSISHSRRFTN
ncbi:hypothetical protein OROHE_001903 [Orobanche hederae]